MSSAVDRTRRPSPNTRPHRPHNQRRRYAATQLRMTALTIVMLASFAVTSDAGNDPAAGTTSPDDPQAQMIWEMSDEGFVDDSDALTPEDLAALGIDTPDGGFDTGNNHELINPIPGAELIDSYGFPRSGGRTHQGIDIFAPEGTTIVAALGGTVIKTRGPGGLPEGKLGGRTITILGTDGRFYYYAHNSENHVTTGDQINTGHPIALVGHTGNARTTPPHLHLGISIGGTDFSEDRAINPYPILTGTPNNTQPPDTTLTAHNNTSTSQTSTSDDPTPTSDTNPTTSTSSTTDPTTPSDTTSTTTTSSSTSTTDPAFTSRSTIAPLTTTTTTTTTPSNSASTTTRQATTTATATTTTSVEPTTTSTTQHDNPDPCPTTTTPPGPGTATTEPCPSTTTTQPDPCPPPTTTTATSTSTTTTTTTSPSTTTTDPDPNCVCETDQTTTTTQADPATTTTEPPTCPPVTTTSTTTAGLNAPR